MSQQIDKITIAESNLSEATKREYTYRVKQFYSFAPIKSDDELIDCPTDELQKMLVNYTRKLLKQVSEKKLSPNSQYPDTSDISWKF